MTGSELTARLEKGFRGHLQLLNVGVQPQNNLNMSFTQTQLCLQPQCTGSPGDSEHILFSYNIANAGYT